MKRILVLGAGQSSPYLTHYLLEHAAAGHWFVTVADRDLALARARVGEHPCGEAIALDANDFTLLTAQIRRADVVVNMLTPFFQHQLAILCVENGKHMVSASYRDQAVRDLHAEAQRKGALILTEVGLDPGIDNMSAMRLIQKIHDRGGEITQFLSYGSGVPAPDSLSNPFRYAITWNPRNVVMSGENGAQYIIGGKVKIVPYGQVFQRSWTVEVEGIGTMEAYPNRDSLSYMATFGLKHVHQMVRGTLRYPGWSETWRQIVRLGLPNETMRVPDLAQRSWREVVEMFVPQHVSNAKLEQRLASHLNISPTGTIMQNLIWLGLLSDAPTGAHGDTTASALAHLLRAKLTLQPGERDMVILQHDLEVRSPAEGGKLERVTSTMIEYGDPNGFTAMSRTVGMPAATAVKLILEEAIPLTGSHIPTHPAIYTPILDELEQEGIAFKERSRPVE